jgi:AcrR family transcriptional regulator
MKTKELIIGQAVKLFNKRGVNAVTTNHIAEEMKISPGNLYYHFRNKQEILLEIYLSMIRFMDFAWIIPSSGNTEKHLISYMKKTMRLQYKYRFFYREIGSLLASDSSLRKLYVENREKRLRQMQDLFRFLEMNGLVKLPVNEEEQILLIEMIWNYSEWWLAFNIYEPSKSLNGLIQKNMKTILFLLKPYISANIDWPIEE